MDIFNDLVAIFLTERDQLKNTGSSSECCELSRPINMDLCYISNTNQGFTGFVCSVFPHSSVIITHFELMYCDCLQSSHIIRVNTVN